MRYSGWLSWIVRTSVLVALVLGACTPAAPRDARTGAASPSAARSGLDVLRMDTRDFGYPQPYTFSRGPGHVLTTYVFDTLVWHDANGLIPWLAKNWKVSEDGKTWTFDLRQGVKWHDEQPFTADDVVFTFQYFKEKTNPWWASQLELIESVKKTSDNGVSVGLSRAYAPFLNDIAASVVIIPRHIWQDVSDPVKFVTPQSVIGTGPYRLVQYDKAHGTYLFEANPGFFLGEPYVRRLELVPTPNSLLALQQGQIDATSAGTQDVATDEVLAPFGDTSKFGMISAPREWTVGLFFNMSRGGPLADVRFRQAIAYAIDYHDLVTRVLKGKGLPGNAGHVAPTSPWYNPNVQQYPRDLAKANQLLDEAGYTARDGDGIRKAPDGKPLRFELIYASNDSPRNPELIKGYLQPIGIDVTPRVMDGSARDSAATDGRYEIVIVGFGGLGGDPDGLRGKFLSTSKSKSFTRVQGYQNARFDELATKQLGEVDQAKRKQMVDEMQAILAKDVPMLSLYYPHEVWVYRKGTIDDWYFASGWYGGGTNGSYKQLFVTGEKIGTAIKGR